MGLAIPALFGDSDYRVIAENILPFDFRRPTFNAFGRLHPLLDGRLRLGLAV